MSVGSYAYFTGCRVWCRVAVYTVTVTVPTLILGGIVLIYSFRILFL